ncbi:MAG: carboxypeptidase-like regulatory domain-containing protein [Acidobacteriota bacterium]|nr:carboxypeptidase-like regulatory domain-containing protein [Acidobacteriota bacterium]
MTLKSALVTGAVWVLGAGCTVRASAAADERMKEADACGYVVDASGSVVSAATVSATNGGRTIATATTFSDGSFHFEDSINTGVDLAVEAKGFVPANGHIERLRGVKSEKKCGHPVYVVLAGGKGLSYITTKKKNVPRTR